MPHERFAVAIWERLDVHLPLWLCDERQAAPRCDGLGQARPHRSGFAAQHDEHHGGEKTRYSHHNLRNCRLYE
jgi:hypothetical protein